MKRLMKDEKGQALVLVLLLLLISTLILTPALNFMGTGVKSGQVYEQKNDEIYAADSGVEDALWHIRNDLIGDVLGTGYNEYDYSTPYPYLYKLLVNGKNVTVTMQNVWIPTITPAPNAVTARQIIDDEKLLIVGYPSSTTSTYVIKIVYNWDTTAHRDALQVRTIGIWLSPGFQYDDSCSLAGYYSTETISTYKGGTAVVWSFTSKYLKNLPDKVSDSPLVITFTFKYTGPQGQIPELVSSWIDTTGVTGITCSWDDSIRLYKIVSTAGNVQIEAYGAKTKFRKLKSTISSDYAVAGNTLEIGTGPNADLYRNQLLLDSSNPITRIPLQSIPPTGIVPAGYIPEEATIDSVYLYWSGWIDPYYWYKSGNNYNWAQISDLRYSQRTKQQLIANSKVGQVKFAVDSATQTITANISGVHSDVPDVQIISTSDCGSSDSWAYSCFKDITNLVVSGNVTVQQYIENAMKSAGSGTVTFTLGHADAVRNLPRPESNPAGARANYYFSLSGDGSTGYPLATPTQIKPSPPSESLQTRYQWSWAGWSLIIFYRSPGLVQRQLYLFDTFRYRSYLGGGADPTFTISGFLAPPVISENDKSHITYFVGEGDDHYVNDRIKVNNSYLSDAHNPSNNVFNSFSNALLPLTLPMNTDGVDVDTFVLPSDCILPYATSAQVTLETNQEIYMMIYLVLSFRSELTTGGIITNYAIKII